ncbi:MAG: outer membrane lipid asymmetry maintenance protein MlaD [Alphaproteobacteria bacterium PRO2]|nr:outer membrane lipid asymmetry maintenance protein MlaD [Alphaproteobacteria bacterium PRO2]
MKRSAIETLLGAFVLAVAGFFLVFSYQTANVGSMNGYTVTADFSGIGGLKAGDDVLISGVKVGTVTSVELMKDSFLARVYMDVASGVELPTDTVALISSESLLGGRYLALEPGADENMLKDGGHIQFTQAPQNLEQLLGQFIFSASGKDKDGAAAQEVPAPASPRVEEAPKGEEEEVKIPHTTVPEVMEEHPAEAAPGQQPAEQSQPEPEAQSEPESEPAHP